MPHIPPMIVAIWCGTSKPNELNEYLSEFVRELNHLLTNQISINNHNITLEIRCFICDTPARAYLKGYIFKQGTFNEFQKFLSLSIEFRHCWT